MNPTLRELARCVGVLNGWKGCVSPFLAVINTAPIAILCERKPALVTSIQCLYWVSSETRAIARRIACARGVVVGGGFPVPSAHCPQRPGATTRARKHALSCPLSALKRVTGELASNRARLGRCDGVCLPHCSQRLSASFHARTTTDIRLSSLKESLKVKTRTTIQESLSRAELFYCRQQVATRGYEAYRLTTGHNSNKRPNYWLLFSC